MNKEQEFGPDIAGVDIKLGDFLINFIKEFFTGRNFV